MEVLEQVLLDEIRELLDRDKTYTQRCNLAYYFRYSQPGTKLTLKVTSGVNSDLWSFIRHYVGRLGSWSKSSKVLVRVAHEAPHLFNNYQLGSVANIARAAMPVYDTDLRLRDALARALPKYDAQLLNRAIKNMQQVSKGNIEDIYAERCKAQDHKPRVHAEISMMEHFYFNQLPFVDDDRYIGCSKPSCYCCDLYLRRHPGKFVPRPCHGNIWVKWCFPFRLDEENTQEREHPVKVLEYMVRSIKRDLKDLVLLDTHQRSFRSDSSTAMSVPSLLVKD